MPQPPDRHKRDGERQGVEDSSGWMNLTDIARFIGKPHTTVYGWYRSNRMPPPDAPHPHSPLWQRRSVLRWARNIPLGVPAEGTEHNMNESVNLLVKGYRRPLGNLILSETRKASTATGGVVMRNKSFGQASIARLLNYTRADGSPATGTVSNMKRNGRLPSYDCTDWYTGSPRWFAGTIAAWLLDNPKFLARVTDAEFLAFVSEVEGKMKDPNGAS